MSLIHPRLYTNYINNALNIESLPDINYKKILINIILPFVLLLIVSFYIKHRYKEYKKIKQAFNNYQLSLHSQ